MSPLIAQMMAAAEARRADMEAIKHLDFEPEGGANAVL